MNKKLSDLFSLPQSIIEALEAKMLLPAVAIPGEENYPPFMAECSTCYGGCEGDCEGSCLGCYGSCDGCSR